MTLVAETASVEFARDYVTPDNKHQIEFLLWFCCVCLFVCVRLVAACLRHFCLSREFGWRNKGVGYVTFHSLVTMKHLHSSLLAQIALSSRQLATSSTRHTRRALPKEACRRKRSLVCLFVCSCCTARRVDCWACG